MEPPAQATTFHGMSRFSVVRMLGAGGMGVVYEVYDHDREAYVALKTLPTLTPENLRRFKNEFRALQDIKHPNLVALDELMEVDGVWFFTMELIDGVDFVSHVRPGPSPSQLPTMPPPAIDDLSSEPFRQLVAAYRHTGDVEATRTDGGGDPLAGLPRIPPPAPEAVPVEVPPPRLSPAGFDEERLRDGLRQLTLGLGALHDAHKVHRDVKPGNVLVTRTGRVVLLDFGLIAEPGQVEQRAVGTANFMAPEQASGRPIGPPADTYAVGVMLYRAMTGASPFTGTAEEILNQKVRFEPRRPSELIAGIPDDLDALCADLLRREPEARPTGREILERLGAVEPPPAAPVTAGFVGRADELAFLDRAFADAVAGRAVAVLIEGDSGVGKSALVRELTDRLVADGRAQVLAGRCYERESVPYKAVDEVMEALARGVGQLAVADGALPGRPDRIARVADLFPAFLAIPAVADAVAARAGAAARAIEPVQSRAFAFAALRELVGSLARRAPLVIAIDDLHWADRDSLALLGELLAPPDPPPLLLCATVRSSFEGAATTLAALRAALGDDVRTLRVERLPHDAARQLVERLLAATGGRGPEMRARADDLAEEAAGHPMFIDALVRHRLEHPGAAGPVRLDDALVARTAALAPEARALLDVVCLAGVPIRQQVCADAVGTAFNDFVQLVGGLRVANLVKTHGIHRADTVEPYHDRVREAIASRLAPAERRDVHGRLARALEASGDADLETLAVHFLESGDRARAAVYAGDAAEAADAALAFDRAARLYRLVLDLDGGDPAHVRALRRRLARALSNSGRGAEAAEVYLQAAGGADPDDVLELRRLAAEQYLRSGRMAEGLACFDAVLATVGMKLPRTRRRAIASFLLERLRFRWKLRRGLRYRRRDEAAVPPALVRRMVVCSSLYPLGLTDTLRGHPFQMRNLRYALDAGVPARILRALVTEVVFSASAGAVGIPAMERWRDEARRLLAGLDDPYLAGIVEATEGTACWLVARWREGAACCDRGEAILREQCTGAAWELDTAQLYGHRNLFFLGELGELRRRLPGALKEARERGDLYLSSNLRLGLPMVHAWLAADDPDAARRNAADGITEWSYEGINLQHVNLLQGGVSIELYAGALDAAERHFAELWPALARSTYLRIELVRVFCTHLRARLALAAAARAAGSERARRVAAARRDARRLAREPAPWARALAVLVEAAAAALAGDAASAAARLDEAELALAAVDMGAFAAAARRQRGRLVGGDHGRALVTAADAWMTAQAIARPVRFAALLAPGFDGE